MESNEAGRVQRSTNRWQPDGISEGNANAWDFGSDAYWLPLTKSKHGVAGNVQPCGSAGGRQQLVW